MSVDWKKNQKNSNLTEMLIKSQKNMFGKSSEQTKYINGSEQLSLFNESEKEYTAAAHTRKKKCTKAESTANVKYIRQIRNGEPCL